MTYKGPSKECVLEDPLAICCFMSKNFSSRKHYSEPILNELRTHLLVYKCGKLSQKSSENDKGVIRMQLEQIIKFSSLYPVAG